MCFVDMKGPENRPSRDEVDLLLRKALASSPEAVIPDSQEFCRRIDCTHECLLGVALSLAADGVVRTEKKSVSSWCLTEEGKTITTEVCVCVERERKKIVCFVDWLCSLPSHYCLNVLLPLR